MYYTEDIRDIDKNDSNASDGRPYVEHPSGYHPDPGLVDAVNVALTLNRPLLVTGEPGTGKTQLAHSVAWQLASRKQLCLASPRVEKFETKSTSIAKDLFYTFDTLKRFHAAHHGGSSDNAAYITYNALGKALLNALPPEQVQAYLPKELVLSQPVRSVILIDEIDKAPRDFPNDLLNEIDLMYFKIPELGDKQIGGPEYLSDDYRPIVFITSNSEKNLPDPFLRRCIYYNIPFPTIERLESILLSRLAHLKVAAGTLVVDTLNFYLTLRKPNVLQRKISPAEIIQWLAFMLLHGAKPNQPLREVRHFAIAGLSALTKEQTDQEKVRRELEGIV